MAHPIQLANVSFPFLPSMANRHGLVAGATGTGKTATLRLLAEHFSDIGVPVLLADVKGDLSGLAVPGEVSEKLKARIDKLGITDFEPRGYPVCFWDVFGEQGHPLRTTISEMGPLLLSRMLQLNETQAGLMSMLFRVADDEGLLLLDLKDLRSMVTYVGENAAKLKLTYGNVSTASVGAIQRALLALEEQGGEHLFGEPALQIEDLLQTDSNGRGIIQMLCADKLIRSPKLYATVLLFLLSEIYETLPEAGDLEKPRLVFFFDEAHLLFDDAPPVLLEKVEQVVRLIRSKGVGVYFVTQSPADVAPDVLGQLGNRVQHALRAFTPRDQKAVKVAADTFRKNPALDTASVILELGVGEAVVSFLDEQGTPAMVERGLIYPPRSRFSPLDKAEHDRIGRQSPVAGAYEKSVDRESAYERLKTRADEAMRQAEQQAAAKQTKAPPVSRREGVIEAMAKSTARSMGTSIGRQIIRGILGAILPGKRRR